MRLYSMACLDCMKIWLSSSKDSVCLHCGSDRVYDTGKAERQNGTPE